MKATFRVRIGGEYIASRQKNGHFTGANASIGQAVGTVAVAGTYGKFVVSSAAVSVRCATGAPKLNRADPAVNPQHISRELAQ
ncbi:MAG: hypothetical protein ABSA57_17180 [Candidatus Acidiferrales bacterium]|jgi:hypothetical protein